MGKVKQATHLGGDGVFHAHKMVKDLAISMAHEVWEECMRSNDWFDGMKAKYPGMPTSGLEFVFTRHILPNLLPQARTQLAMMLNQNDITLQVKEQIHEALIKDSSLPKGRQTAKGVYS